MFVGQYEVEIEEEGKIPLPERFDDIKENDRYYVAEMYDGIICVFVNTISDYDKEHSTVLCEGIMKDDHMLIINGDSKRKFIGKCTILGLGNSFEIFTEDNPLKNYIDEEETLKLKLYKLINL